LWIRIGFNQDPDPAVQLNPDPDPAVQLNPDPDPAFQLNPDLETDPDQQSHKSGSNADPHPDPGPPQYFRKQIFLSF
jgi:hypothetical protein